MFSDSFECFSAKQGIILVLRHIRAINHEFGTQADGWWFEGMLLSRFSHLHAKSRLIYCQKARLQLQHPIIRLSSGDQTSLDLR